MLTSLNQLREFLALVARNYPETLVLSDSRVVRKDSELGIFVVEKVERMVFAFRSEDPEANHPPGVSPVFVLEEGVKLKSLLQK